MLEAGQHRPRARAPGSGAPRRPTPGCRPVRDRRGQPSDLGVEAVRGGRQRRAGAARAPRAPARASSIVRAITASTSSGVSTSSRSTASTAASRRVSGTREVVGAGAVHAPGVTGVVPARGPAAAVRLIACIEPPQTPQTRRGRSADSAPRPPASGRPQSRPPWPRYVLPGPVEPGVRGLPQSSRSRSAAPGPRPDPLGLGSAILTLRAARGPPSGCAPRRSGRGRGRGTPSRARRSWPNARPRGQGTPRRSAPWRSGRSRAPAAPVEDPADHRRLVRDDLALHVVGPRGRCDSRTRVPPATWPRSALRCIASRVRWRACSRSISAAKAVTRAHEAARSRSSSVRSRSVEVEEHPHAGVGDLLQRVAHPSRCARGPRRDSSDMMSTWNGGRGLSAFIRRRKPGPLDELRAVDPVVE